MANKVTAQVIGGEPRVLDGVCSVRDVKRAMGVPTYTASVNGDQRDDSFALEDYAFVSLAAPVKGGSK
jgi:hypothetical protein